MQSIALGKVVYQVFHGLTLPGVKSPQLWLRQQERKTFLGSCELFNTLEIPHTRSHLKQQQLGLEQ